MSIRAVTFDLDDTLWDVSHTLRNAEQETFAYLCMTCPLVPDHHSIQSIRNLMHEIAKQQPELIHKISLLRRTALARAIEQSGYTPEEAEIQSEAAFDVFLEGRHRVEFFNHTIEVLEQLHKKYQIGAITNGNADVNRLSIGVHFDFALRAEEFRSSKPQPTLFMAALEHTGVTPAECIHVGDHPEYDILGAQQAGFHTVWVNINNQSWPGGMRASEEIQCLSDLPQAIRSIEAQAA